MVRRPALPASSVGSAVGGPRRDFSIHSTLRPSLKFAWSGTLRRDFLARLAASLLRAAALRGNRLSGRISASALSYEAHRPSTHLGFHPCPNRFRFSHSVLGSAPGTAAFSGGLCVSQRIYSKSH